MKKMLIMLGTLGVLVSPAIAADDLSGLYGNTVVVSGAGDGSGKYFVNEDQTLTWELADGRTGAGTWELKDGEVCFTAPAAEGATRTDCDASPVGKGVGDSWALTDEAGAEAGTATVVAGR